MGIGCLMDRLKLELFVGIALLAVGPVFLGTCRIRWILCRRSIRVDIVPFDRAMIFLSRHKRMYL